MRPSLLRRPAAPRICTPSAAITMSPFWIPPRSAGEPPLTPAIRAPSTPGGGAPTGSVESFIETPMCPRRFWASVRPTALIVGTSSSPSTLAAAALQSGSLERSTREAAIVEALLDQAPALMGLALHVSSPGLALRIERVEVLLEAVLGRHTGVDGAA